MKKLQNNTPTTETANSLQFSEKTGAKTKEVKI
jgi:hypothetical protein